MHGIAMFPLVGQAAEMGITPSSRTADGTAAADALFRVLLEHIIPENPQTESARMRLQPTDSPSHGQSLQALVLSALLAHTPADEPQAEELHRSLRGVLGRTPSDEASLELPVASLPPEVMGAVLTLLAGTELPTRPQQEVPVVAPIPQDQSEAGVPLALRPEQVMLGRHQQESVIQQPPHSGALQESVQSGASQLSIPSGASQEPLPQSVSQEPMRGMQGLLTQTPDSREAPTFQNLLRMAAQVDEDLAAPRSEGPARPQIQQVNVSGRVPPTAETTNSPAPLATLQAEPTLSSLESTHLAHQETALESEVQMETAKPAVRTDAGHVTPVSAAPSAVEFISAEEPQIRANHSQAIPTESVLRQVNRYVKVMLDGDRSEVRLKLHPAELGLVTVKVVVEQGVVKAHLTAQEPAVRAALEANLDQLRTRFAEQGLQVAAISVAVGSDGAFNPFQESGHTPERWSEGDSARPQGQEDSEGEHPADAGEHVRRPGPSGSRFDRLA